MDVKELGVAKFKGQEFGIIAKTDDGREIIVAGGFSTKESAIVNIGALLGKYSTLFFYDNEYPIDRDANPAPYSLQGANATWNDTQTWLRETYWITNKYCVLQWYTHRNIFID